MEEKNEVAYWAGFVDADGSIHLSKHMRGYVPTVSVEQKDLDILLKFGRFLEAKNIKYFITDRDNRNTYMLAVANQQHVYNLLKLLLPFLKVKKRKARAVFAFCIHRMRNKGKKYDLCDRKLISLSRR